MKNIFEPGHIKVYEKIVQPNESATFDSGQVHPVYATFALARDAEWACRLFVLEMKDVDEEGIGTFITVNHKSPALIGEQVIFTAEVKEVNGNELICTYKAIVNDRLIADGKTGQKILKKEKLEKIFSALENTKTV